MNDTRSHSHLYTVRLWPEPVAGGEMVWHGKVTHVLSGETRYFREWSALIAYLQAALLADGSPQEAPRNSDPEHRAPAETQ